jgi:DNA-binding Lrp family transcriptional regulator
VSRERDILKLYHNNLCAVYTIRAIASRLGLAYPYVHRTVTKLLVLGALRAVTLGGSRCISLNLNNRRAVLYLTEIELEKRAALPEAIRAFAETLDCEGTLAIETVVAGNDAVYLVGEGHYTGVTTLTREQFLARLLTTDLFTHHTVLHGYERFFRLIAANQSSFDDAYHPLLLRAGVRT